MQRLQAARRDLALEAALAKNDRFDLIILDDLTYAQKDQTEGSALFEIIARRHETMALAVAANQPFSAWDRVFPDHAVTVAAIDRLVHHATIRIFIDRRRHSGRRSLVQWPESGDLAIKRQATWGMSVHICHATERLHTEDTSIDPVSPPRIRTGIDGLDMILDGGLPRGGLYLIEGQPGSGKTTVALQYLLTGVARGEPALLISLSETTNELVTFAASHGWSLDDIDIMDLSDLRRIMGVQGSQSVFHSSEVELMEAIKLIRSRIAETKPIRIVIDSLSEFRHLAGDEATYRLNMDALKSYLIEDGRTVVFVDTLSSPSNFALHTMAHGVINLSFICPEVGPYRRQLRIQKLRGVKFQEGLHDFEVLTGRLAVYPRLVPASKRNQWIFSQAASGLDALDSILGGGLDRGTSTLIMGPAGSGKSTLASQFADAACKRGEKVAMYLFDEHLGTMLARSHGVGMDLSSPLSEGLLTIQTVDPMELSPGKFAHLVRSSVEDGVTMIVIDSLTGYMTSMGDQGHLTLQIRNLLSYLAESNVATLMISVQHGLLGADDAQSENLSYIADNVVLLRYYEHRGDVRRALSVFKRRAGPHERTIRDIEFSPTGIRVGPPVTQFRGVLQGEPVLEVGQEDV